MIPSHMVPVPGIPNPKTPLQLQGVPLSDQNTLHLQLC